MLLLITLLIPKNTRNWKNLLNNYNNAKAQQHVPKRERQLLRVLPRIWWGEVFAGHPLHTVHFIQMWLNNRLFLHPRLLVCTATEPNPCWTQVLAVVLMMVVALAALGLADQRRSYCGWRLEKKLFTLCHGIYNKRAGSGTMDIGKLRERRFLRIIFMSIEFLVIWLWCRV